jgi:hypothetical protein
MVQNFKMDLSERRLWLSSAARVVSMNRFMLVASLTLAVACLDGTGKLSAHEDTRWPDRFSKEAPEQWAKYRARASRLQGSWSYVVSSIVSPNQKRLRVKRYQELKQRNGCALYLEQKFVEGEKEDGGAWLESVNPSYGFELHRSTPDGPWAVSQFGKDLWSQASINTPSWWVEEVTTLPYRIWDMGPALQVMVKEAGFTVKQVTPVSRDGRQFAGVEFAYQPADPSVIPLRGGWVLFDPDRYWVTRGFELQTDWSRAGSTSAKGTDEASLEYVEAGDGFPILKQIVYTRQIPTRGNHTEFRYEYDLREADVPESDFTLSAFGFPEPVGIGKEPTRWYIWVAVAAVVCLALAGFFRWLARRGKPA